ncbi:hypothetical protein [Embleya sp. AB8]|uniref:hypothetical protein n=1 Tax=Embleya sp. AB8 TaxID=3156304 RepID=UPI003C73DF26
MREPVLTDKRLSGRTVTDVNATFPTETEGVYLTGLQRVGQDLPATGETEHREQHPADARLHDHVTATPDALSSRRRPPF